MVPLLDFSESWTDEKVYDMLELTKAERAAIDAFLHDYYGRKSSMEADDADMEDA